MNFKIISIFCFVGCTVNAAILGIPALGKLAKANSFRQYRALRDPADDNSPADSSYNLDDFYALYAQPWPPLQPAKRSYGKFFSEIPQMQIY